jgi:hypothetical protein
MTECLDLLWRARAYVALVCDSLEKPQHRELLAEIETLLRKDQARPEAQNEKLRP